MGRPTKKFKTSNGHEVEINTYVTFGESKQISDVFLKGVNFELGSDGQPKFNEVNASVSNDAQNKAIETIVVSIDGITENIIEAMDNLPKQDGDEIVAEIDKVQNPINDKKKQN